MPRRHDIDALRVIAFALLILYHVGMVYVADWGYHIKSSYQAEWLQWPMIALNRWRMPLLFMISGIAIGLSRPERAPARFALLRSWRLLLPLVFGMLAIVPVQAYCEGVANGHVAPGFGAFLLRYWQVRPWPEGSFSGWQHGITWNHLWYLAYLWTYTIVLAALLPILHTHPGCRMRAWLGTLPSWMLIVLPASLLVACLLVLEPRFPETHALFGDWYVHAESFTLFLFGYAIACEAGFWERVQRLRWATLALALVCITIELSLRAAGRYLPLDQVPAALQQISWGMIERVARATYTWTALLAVFGWGYTLLNRPFRWLPYATEAVYPWYILHQSLIIPIAFWLIPVRTGPIGESLLLISGTVAGCLVLHEFAIRRVGLLRPLFGLKGKNISAAKDVAAAEAQTPG
ncbi:MAG TPA: acyltransferase family protein [Pseudoxanthomonas sp.]|nr:acyltransferase family protein [Pseudoxanthomonas sp.]